MSLVEDNTIFNNWVLPTYTGDKIELITVPSIIEPLLINELEILASKPILTGGISSLLVWILHLSSYKSKRVRV